MSQAISSASPLIRFSVFELDLRAGELRKNGAKVRLEGQPLQVLALLLEQPGQMVTREELQRKLWPADTFVDFEHSINTAVKRLREALDDSATAPRFIETLPRRGYRFIYPVNGAAAALAGAAEPGRRWLPAVIAAAAVGALALLLALNFGGVRDRLLGSAVGPPVRSLAVLPLENLTGDPGQEYLVDGIHDELITELAQIGALKVISRTSVLRYKEQKKSLREIAGELHVDGVLEGAVRREGDRWHLTAQLISARDDHHLWAQSYDRGLRDMPTLPSEVARAVANRLHISLTPQEQVRLAKAQPVDPAVYQAYFKGKYYASKWTNGSLLKAVGYFREALDIDPTYAPAWAGMGGAYQSLGSFAHREGQGLSRDDARRRAQAGLLRAVELDPTLRAPHQALGRMKFAEWDWEGGAREFERARELDPSHPGFPVYLLNTGRFDEAVDAQRRAAELDPLNYASQLVVGWTAFMAGHYDEAIVALKRTIDLDPSIHHAHYELAWSYVKKGMYQEAIAECETSLALLRQKQPEAVTIPSCGWVYATAGRRREALDIARKLEKKPGDEGFIPVAHTYDALGDRERALAFLNKAYGERAVLLPRQWSSRMLSDAMKSDPRFQELIRRTGNPWARFPTARSLAAISKEPDKRNRP
jgi:TolB-like protein/DNA-binding winged helix-turn-helix (wHTH) protein/Tfp pilus assembly protein PilF